MEFSRLRLIHYRSWLMIWQDLIEVWGSNWRKKNNSWRNLKVTHQNLFHLLHRCWLMPPGFRWNIHSAYQFFFLHWDMQDIWCRGDDGPPFFHVLSTHLIRNLSLLHAFSLMYCHLDIICMILKDVQWRFITRYNIIIISFFFSFLNISLKHYIY